MLRSTSKFLHSDEFLAIKYLVEFITCFAIIAGVLRHWGG